MLNVVYPECPKLALSAEYHYAECRYAECCYAECRSAINTILSFSSSLRPCYSTQLDKGKAGGLTEGECSVQLAPLY
jgi:hypothetical protein